MGRKWKKVITTILESKESDMIQTNIEEATMKVLVTGGTGFTGSHLVRRLCRLGYKVRVLVRDKSKKDVFQGLDVQFIEGDITDSDVVERSVIGVEKVFHIAAAYRTAGITDKVYWDVHLKGTENLLRSSLKYGVERFIHCSTVGVHGHIEQGPANENYRFQPGDVYQLTKLKGEQKAMEFAHSKGLAVTVIRPCAIYGPGDLRLLKLFKLASKRITPVLGSGNIYYHMVYIDDLIHAFILAAEVKEAIGEAFIIGGEEIFTLNELLYTISELLSVSKTKIHLPATPFRIVASIVEKICIPLKIEPPIYKRRVDFFTKSRAFDINKAKKILGYKPAVNITEGLKLTALWYTKYGLL